MTGTFAQHPSIPRPVRVLARIAIIAIGIVAIGVTACSEAGGTGPRGAPKEVGEYLTSLPSWASFSPTLPDQPPTPAGDIVALPPDTLDVESVQEDGTVSIVPDVIYACTERPYSIRSNPTQVVMFSPDAEILWPGSLIQGKSHRDGLGALLGLTIAERTPIRVSIPAIPSADNFREVALPNQANVAAAVGEIRGNATTANLSTPSTITFEQTVTHSESQLALSLRISGRYLGFKAKAAADFSRNSSETTVTAQFYQKMFEVVVAPPQTPGAFFSADFTKARLDQQVALQRMGPDNLPVYVSTVVYGRMLMVSVTSSQSEQKIRAALSASYDAVAGEVSGSLEAKHRTLLENSRISITSLGGDAEATLAMIRSGRLADYFTANAPLSSAAPLSYTFRNLSDGSIASVTEATEYSLKTCEPRAATPGSFEFRAVVSSALGIPTPVRTLTGNFDGSAANDILLNHLGTSNQMRVARADAAGAFSLGPVVTHPETPAEGWPNFTSAVGDYNQDGRADVAWAHASAAAVKVYLGLGNADGSFSFPSVRSFPGIAWASTQVIATDLTGDGCTDLFWNSLTTTNRWLPMISDCASNFSALAVQQPSNMGWGPYALRTGDVDANQRRDIVWRSTFRTYFGPASVTGSLAVPTAMVPMDNPNLGATAGYVLLEGDVNGDGRIDMIWADTTTTSGNRVTVSTSTGSALTHRALQTFQYAQALPLRVRTGDVNADGRIDLVWTTTGATNTIFVALGKDDGTFDISPQSQPHPVTVNDWEQFAVLVTDVTGDARADIVWIHPATTVRMYVGLARAP